MMRFASICLCLVWATVASAQSPRTNLGTLTCTLSEDAQKQTTPAAGEERAMRCAFKPTESGAEQIYSGSIRRVVQGEAPKGTLVMMWVVQGTVETKLEPGLLEQTYVGARDGVPNSPAGVMLIGERNREIVMRPETAHGTPGSNLVVTVMELKMLSVPA